MLIFNVESNRDALTWSSRVVPWFPLVDMVAMWRGVTALVLGKIVPGYAASQVLLRLAIAFQWLYPCLLVVDAVERGTNGFLESYREENENPMPGRTWD
jgi:hypothetical protein